ncbi:hypothetical protein C0J52_06071 [Blattella germanica]|nr:hypothetical protein C0J52_06071 [Blattella germanica]
MEKNTAEKEVYDKNNVKQNNDTSDDEVEAMEVKGAPQTEGQNNPKSNNMDISRSPSTSSLASSSQNDEFVRNGNYADEGTSPDPEIIAEEVKIPVRNLPANNVQEKIVLCIDLTEDPNSTYFKLGDGTKYPPFYMIRRVVEIFINSKNLINKNHEFALVVLQSDSAAWLRDFTNEPRDIISVLNDISDNPQGEIFDLTSLFDVIKNHVTLPPAVEDRTVCPPKYVVRAVLLYARSHCVPKFLHGRDSLKFLLSSDYFTLDTLYIHEDPSETNKCEEIFNVLYELDDRGFSYVLDVPRNTTKLHDSMAKLLGHPLQRPVQKVAYYKLELQEVR